MRKKLFALALLLVFVFSLGFSFTAAVEEASADYCENCWGFCWCQLQMWQGRMIGGQCDLNACTQCSGPGINCI